MRRIVTATYLVRPQTDPDDSVMLHADIPGCRPLQETQSQSVFDGQVIQIFSYRPEDVSDEIAQRGYKMFDEWEAIVHRHLTARGFFSAYPRF